MYLISWYQPGIPRIKSSRKTFFNGIHDEVFWSNLLFATLFQKKVIWGWVQWDQLFRLSSLSSSFRFIVWTKTSWLCWNFYTIRLILFVQQSPLYGSAIYTRDFLLHVSFVVSINISIHLSTFWCVAHNRKQATKHQLWPADLAWIWRFF